MKIVKRITGLADRLAVLLVAVCSAIAWMVMPFAVSASEDLPICWSPAQLKHVRNESSILKNIAAAYRAPLAGTPKAVEKAPNFVRGAIRRVRLPANVKKIALTFDLCEQPYEISGYQGDIVDYLRSE
ncbi:MAG: hypothetical protein AAF709_20005, partial [Pseudomonadota bacterium]